MTALQIGAYIPGNKMLTLWPHIGQFGFTFGDRSSTIIGPGEVATNAPRRDIGSRLSSVSLNFSFGPQQISLGGVFLTDNVSQERHFWKEEYPDASGDFDASSLKLGLLPNTFASTIGYKLKVTDITFSQRYNFNFVVGTASGSSITAGKVVSATGSVDSDGLPIASVMDGTTGTLALGVALETVSSGKFAYASISGYMPYGFVSGALLAGALYVDAAGDLTTTPGTYQVGNIDALSTSTLNVGIMHRF
jgi:hypothetical protein